jgi:hypothetical protein
MNSRFKKSLETRRNLRDIGVYGSVTLKGKIYSGLRMLETPEKYTKPTYTKKRPKERLKHRR